jgi:UDP-N-acetylglucosamine acyltransferase
VSEIHPTAIIGSGAEIDETARVGPYAFVGPNVSLGKGVVLRAHACVTGYTTVGEETEIFPFAVVGEVPQDLKYKGEATRVVIGARNTIREHVTINIGTTGGGGLTRIGDDNLLMSGAHVGHDSHVGNHTILGNNVLLAGHVTVEDYAVIYAQAAVQTYLRVGESAFLAAKAGLMQDLAPFTWAQGHPTRVLKINRVGMERRGIPAARIQAVERAFRTIFRSGQRPREAFEAARAEATDCPEVERLIAFLEKSEHGFARVR